jgi:hypothetical protein
MPSTGEETPMFFIERFTMKRTICGLLFGCLFLALTSPALGEDLSPQALIAKGIAARGGAEKLSKAQTQNFQGKGTFMGLGQAIEFKGEWWVQPPDKFRNVISIDAGGQKFEILQVVNGSKGWRSMMGNVEEMTEDQLSEAKEEMHAGRVAQLVELKDPEFKLTAIGGTKVKDADTLGVKVSRKNYKDVSLFFDKNSGLLLMSRHRAKDQMSGQEVERDTVYSNYKDLDGIKQPMKISTKQDGKDFVEMTIVEWKSADKLDDKLFTKPTS